MGRNKVSLLKFLLVFVLLSSAAYPQKEYVPYNNPVYNFLDRMSSQQIITGYNNFQKPKTRKFISDYLKEVILNQSALNPTDKRILEDLKVEFEYELYSTTKYSSHLFENGFNWLSDKERYFYFLTDSGKATIFINVTGEAQDINYNELSPDKMHNGVFAKWGGMIRGSFLNKFGFYVKATNGYAAGDRIATRSLKEVEFNYKYNLGDSINSGNDYLDNTEGYLTADFDYVKFKIGRDRQTIGYGPINNILNDNVPQFDYISMAMDYKFLSFNYFHGKLLGSINSYTDSIQGGIRNVTEKYIGYHRLGFNISKHINFGLGEMIVYSRRPIDFSYLNPFNFYKSIEHSNQDRDNSFLFLDFTNNSLKGLKLFGSVLIDDIDFSKLGTGWYGNLLQYNFVAYSSNLYNIVPVDISFQYIRTNPYVYTHRINDNNYSNSSYNLVDPIQPNSYLLALRLNYKPYYRIDLTADLFYSEHGANELNTDGTVKRNVGGNIFVGHREFDPTTVTFLDGDLEVYRQISFSAVYEPINNYFISARINYEYNNLQHFEKQNFLAFYYVLYLRL